MVSQNVKANGAIGVDVRVVYLGRKADLGRLEGVVGGEADRKKENATRVGGIALWTDYEVRLCAVTEMQRTGPIIVACH